MNDITVLPFPTNPGYVSVYTNNRALASLLAEGDRYMLEDSDDDERVHNGEFEVNARYRIVLTVGTIANTHKRV